MPRVSFISKALVGDSDDPVQDAHLLQIVSAGAEPPLQLAFETRLHAFFLPVQRLGGAQGGEVVTMYHD